MAVGLSAACVRAWRNTRSAGQLIEAVFEEPGVAEETLPLPQVCSLGARTPRALHGGRRTDAEGSGSPRSFAGTYACRAKRLHRLHWADLSRVITSRGRAGPRAQKDFQALRRPLRPRPNLHGRRASADRAGLYDEGIGTCGARLRV